MKNGLYNTYFNRYFLLFILLFAYAESIHGRLLVRGELNAFTFTPEAAFSTLISVSFLFFIITIFIKYWQKSDVFNTKEIVKIFSSSIVSYLLIMQIFGFIIAAIFGNIERNFNRETLSLSTFSNLLDGIIYGSFFLAYTYFNKNKSNQEQLSKYHKALSESRINQLKAQLNPHFLFNNLNVLDQLIDEDKNKASEFLNEFAEIYRYVLQATDRELVTLNEELVFAQQFFNLIQHKYEKIYQLIIENKDNQGFIVPLTSQLLIENAVQHNKGTVENPVIIRINAANDLIVSNNCNPKLHLKPTSGRALNNLKEQYELLTDKRVEIMQSEKTFEVIIPIIYRQES